MKFTQPLLAAKSTDEDLKRLRYPVLVSPKIDGIRATVVGGVLVSRTLKPIPNPHVQQAYGRPELEGLDGELVVGNPWDKNCMQKTMGVTRKSGIVNADFYTFDMWDRPYRFADRIALTHATVANNSTGGLRAVQHSYVEGYHALLTVEAEYLSQGYEGLMIRDPHGRYKMGRSTLREGILIKVKRFDDSEAQVLDYEPLYRNDNDLERDERGYAKRSTAQDNLIADDLLGSLHVQDLKSGIIFRIGSGFTLAQRQSLWDERLSLKGKIIKYKSFSIGVKDKPRHPIFLGFRSRIDI